MTEPINLNLPTEILNFLATDGLQGLPQTVSLLINHAMLLERQRHLGAAPYQRVAGRNGHANGFKARDFDTRLGTLDLRVPQVRGSTEPFYHSAMERGQRSERALILAIAEMYLQGVSTRRVTKILQEPCGLEITSTQVSRAAAELDTMLEAWRNRPTPPVSHLILDARYEKVHVGGIVRSCAVLTAIGASASTTANAPSWASRTPSPRPRSTGATSCAASKPAVSSPAPPLPATPTRASRLP